MECAVDLLSLFPSFFQFPLRWPCLSPTVRAPLPGSVRGFSRRSGHGFSFFPFPLRSLFFPEDLLSFSFNVVIKNLAADFDETHLRGRPNSFKHSRAPLFFWPSLPLSFDRLASPMSVIEKHF